MSIASTATLLTVMTKENFTKFSALSRFRCNGCFSFYDTIASLRFFERDDRRERKARRRRGEKIRFLRGFMRKLISEGGRGPRGGVPRGGGVVGRTWRFKNSDHKILAI